MIDQLRCRSGLMAMLIAILVACSPTTPVPTSLPSPVIAEPTATRTPTPTDAPTPTGTPLPLPTLTPTAAPTEVARPDEGSTLERHRLAMRPGFAGDLEALAPLPHYSIEVTVNPKESLVRGSQVVSYVNRDTLPQTEVYFRLFPNLTAYGGEMTVSDVRVDGRTAWTDLLVEHTALRVPLPEPLGPGQRAVVELDFQILVPRQPFGYGQFVLDREIMALANFFPLIPAFDRENCDRFGKCDGGWNIEYPVPYGDAVFSETALFDLRVTAPAGWIVAASGSTIGRETNAAGDVTWHVVSGPMRDLNLVLSPRFQVSSTEIDGITLRSYYLPEHEDGGTRVLEWAAAAMAFFDGRFGPYPFAEFDIVETPTVAGGIEYPGLIVMPIHSYEQSSFFFQWATVHEVAHQWWYSVVGNDQQDEPWLDEALAQYSTALFYESELGWSQVVDEVLRGYYQPLAGTDLDQSFSRPMEAYTESTYGPLVYGKGPLFFHAVRDRVGLDTFYQILQTYYSTYRYQVAGGNDWLEIADQIAQEDLTSLYEEWIGEWSESR